MIKKFIEISGTGKFLNYGHSSIPQPHRTTDFEKINLVYGENGSGKTTLSVILQSLKGNNNLLLKKRAFNKTFPQTIRILRNTTSSQTHTFANNSWDNHYHHLEIFDIHFINKNIYTGFEVQNTHKKNLFEIIFGAQGIQLKNDIQQLKDKIQKTNTSIKETGEKIEIAIDKAYKADDYCNLTVTPDIDNKISAKLTEITTAKNFQEIQTKASLAILPIINIPYDNSVAIEILSQSIDNISETYLQKVQEHKKHLSINGKEEEWLKQGFEAIKNDSCPFCLRPFEETTEIIEAYKQYFNDKYNSLLRSLSQIDLDITSFNLEAQLLKLETQIINNQNLIEFWKNYIQNPPILISTANQHQSLKAGFELVKSLFKKKSLNPIQPQNIDDITKFKSIIDDFNSNLINFNSNITAYNLQITSLKSSKQSDITQLEHELKKLKAIKKKDDDAIAILCRDFLRYNQMLIVDKQSKDNKQEQLDVYTATIFKNYTTKINQYLQSFASYLEIRDIDSGYVGSSKEPMIKYVLCINGNEIKLEDNDLHPTFKYSLSEGDKSALALAFFLTKLELDNNLQDKIIIFDDPVSSFDLNRKSTTISKLINLGMRAKQLFVFTHNLIFASEFWKSANQISSSTQCSKIEFIKDTSCIVEFNIDTETLSSILKDSLAIKKYLTEGCFTDEEKRGIARCLRPALESYFHLKFFDVVKQNDWLGDFIGKVRDSKPSDQFYRLKDNLDELSDINDYSKKYHHRFNASNENEPITDAELKNFCERTLKLIQLI